MANIPTKQLRGIKDLLQDAVDAGVDATEQVHRVIARQPYAALEKIDLIAAPVHAVERVQNAVTGLVYHSIRTINKLSGTLAGRIIDSIEQADTGNKR